jgi:hypothetical protein
METLVYVYAFCFINYHYILIATVFIFIYTFKYTVQLIVQIERLIDKRTAIEIWLHVPVTDVAFSCSSMKLTSLYTNTSLLSIC